MNDVVVISIGQGTSGASERELADALSREGYRIWLTPHLYHQTGDDPLWAALRDVEGRVAVLAWMHPRPIAWLLAARGIPPEGIAGTANLAVSGTPEMAVEWLKGIGVEPGAGGVEDCTDCRQLPNPSEPPSAFAALTLLPPLRVEDSNKGQNRAVPGERWYPVIDRDRCTDCRHCLEFCLFGVHALSDAGRVSVVNEDNCKPGCPACSRICPNGAIMFPLYAKDEAIAGAPGLFMSPDADAKRMFYMRTGGICPSCGQSGPFRLTLESRKGGVCPECGRPVVAVAPSGPVHDEIDALIGRLDEIAKKGR